MGEVTVTMKAAGSGFMMRVLVAVVIAGALALAPSAFADSFDELFAKLLTNPDDPALNKAFARAAEERGDIRHAFAALERVVTSSPGDTLAQAEFDRVRNKIRPAVTNVTVQVGASYTSNPLHAPRFANRPGDATFDASIGVADERTIAGIRWRSRVVGYGQLQADLHDLNFGIIAAESGPVFDLTPNLWVHLAAGTAVAWEAGEKLFDDLSVSATFGGLYRGLTQSVTARYTWRDGSFNNFHANDAGIFELQGRFVVSPSLTTGDLLYLLPSMQVSRADNVVPVWWGGWQPLFPGDYIEAGGRVAYYFPINRGQIFLGAGIGVFHRWYDEETSWFNWNIEDRRDLYIEPTAHVIVPNLIAPNVDLRFDYRFEGNYSNDMIRDYENHVAGARVVGRF